MAVEDSEGQLRPTLPSSIDVDCDSDRCRNTLGEYAPAVRAFVAGVQALRDCAFYTKPSMSMESSVTERADAAIGSSTADVDTERCTRSAAGFDDKSHDSAATHNGQSTAAPQAPLSASWRKEPLSADEKYKVHHILKACRDRNVTILKDLASSDGGLVEDELRRTACMLSRSLLSQCGD